MGIILFILFISLPIDAFADVCFKLTVINHSGKTVHMKNVFGDKYSEVVLNSENENEIDIKDNEMIDILIKSFTPDDKPKSSDCLVFSSDKKETKVVINPSFLGSDFIYIENETNALNISKEIRPCGVGYNLIIQEIFPLPELHSTQNDDRCVSFVQWVFGFYKKIMC